MKKLTKKSLSLLILICVLGVAVLGGVGTGIYFGVSVVACEGYVLDDTTGSAIANVSVTDGKNVIKTDSQGKYKLKGWHKASFITVTIPSGYWTDDYYIRIQQGANYNFNLTKLDKDLTDHSFIQVTDSEINAKGAGKWLDDLKLITQEQDPAFIIHTGDICYEDGLKKHIEQMNSQTMGVPVRYIIGNHDYVKYGKYSEQLFEDLYGPVWYSFDVGNIHYIVTPFGTGADYLPRYTLSETLTWLKNDLANVEEGKKIVMFNHDNNKDEQDFVIKSGNKSVNMREEGMIAWVFGHWHYSYVNQVDGILNVCTAPPGGGGIDSSPAAIRTFNVQNDTIKSAILNYYEHTTSPTEQGATWQSQLSGRGYFGEPIVVGDKVYVGTAQDDYPSNPTITCVDFNTGEKMWEYKTVNSIKNDIKHQDGKIYAQDGEGIVYCIDATTGKEIWKKDIDLTYVRNTSNSIVVDNDKVYAGKPNKIVCLNANDGSVVWEAKTDRGENSPFKPTIFGDALIIGANWDVVYAFDKNTGKRLWKSDSKRVDTVMSPALYDNKILLASGDRIYALDQTTGKVVKENNIKDYNFNVSGRPHINNGIAYFGSVKNGVVAINLETFEIVWEYTTTDNILHSSPYSSKGGTVEGGVVEHNNRLYFGASDGYVYCVDLNGKLVGKFNIGSPIISKIAIQNDSLVVVDFDGRLTKIELNKLG